MKLLVAALALFLTTCTLTAPLGAELVPGSPRLAEIARYGALSQNPRYSPVYDRSVTVTDQAVVAKLAADANHLPPFSKETMLCPFDDGSHYVVRFVYTNGFVRMLFAEIWGCQGVGFEDGTNWVAWSATDQRFLDGLASLFRKS